MQRAIHWLAAVLFLASVVLAYLVIHQKIEIAQVMQEAAQTRRELARAKAEAVRANARRETAEKETQKQILGLQQQLAAAKAAEVQAEKQLAAASPGGNTKANGLTVIRFSDIEKDHPGFSAMFANVVRRNIDRTYGDAFNTLNLSPSQLSQLKDLLVERAMTGLDARGLAGAAGLEEGSAAWQGAMKQASQDVDRQINGILGSNGVATLTQLQTRVGIQNQVASDYAQGFAAAGIPLTPEQSRGLIQAMADADYAGKDPSTSPSGYDDVDPATGLTPHHNRMLDSAAQVLSPAQIQILKTDKIENNRVLTILREYRAKNKGPLRFVP